MTKGEKLAKLLDSKGPGERSRLGRELIDRGLESGAQMPNKWCKDKSFIRRNQKLVIEIYGLDPDYFDDADDTKGRASQHKPDHVHGEIRYASLRAFLRAPPEPIAPDEVLWLISQRFDDGLGDLGTIFWWYASLKSYRVQRDSRLAEREPTKPGPKSPPGSGSSKRPVSRA